MSPMICVFLKKRSYFEGIKDVSQWPGETEASHDRVKTVSHLSSKHGAFQTWRNSANDYHPSQLHNHYPSPHVTGDVVERLVELQRQTEIFPVPITMDVQPQSTLQVPAGQPMRLIFSVTNNQPQTVRLIFTCQVRNVPFVFPPLFIMPRWWVFSSTCEYESSEHVNHVSGVA